MKKKYTDAPDTRTEAPENAPEQGGTPAGEAPDASATATGFKSDAAGPEPGEAGGVRAAALQDELHAAQAEIEDLKDKYLRARAEADNTRRRAEKEIANTRKYAIDRFAAEMLTVRDSLELARTVDIQEREGDSVAKMLEGLELTLKQMDSVFGKFGIEVVAPEPGEKLDPDRHQAMSTQESSEIPPNHIVSVVQNGYMLKDRLLRPAMVIVARTAEPTATQPPAQENA